MTGQSQAGTALPTGQLWRVGRRASPYRFSEITPEIDAQDNAGNRFDVLGGGVLYLSKMGNHECWAVFDGTRFNPSGQSFIEKHDRHYQAACVTLGLLAH